MWEEDGGNNLALVNSLWSKFILANWCRNNVSDWFLSDFLFPPGHSLLYNAAGSNGVIIEKYQKVRGHCFHYFKKVDGAVLWNHTSCSFRSLFLPRNMHQSRREICPWGSTANVDEWKISEHSFHCSCSFIFKFLASLGGREKKRKTTSEPHFIFVQKAEVQPDRWPELNVLLQPGEGFSLISLNFVESFMHKMLCLLYFKGFHLGWKSCCGTRHYVGWRPSLPFPPRKKRPSNIYFLC